MQLFDQNGQPPTTVGPGAQFDEWDYYFWGGGGPTPVAQREIGRQPVWNVYPLRELSAEDATQMYGDPLSVTLDDAAAPTFPFAQVPSVAPTTATDTRDETTEGPVPVVTESPAP